MNAPPALIEFAKNEYALFDASHDISHVERVWTNAQAIMDKADTPMSDKTREMIMYACYLHDIIDHKYVKGADQIANVEHRLREFVTRQIGAEQANVLIAIIKNISWSSEVAGENKSLPEQDVRRRIVQNADWLDAIGNPGIKRCYDYGVAKYGLTGNSAIPRILAHIDDKLLKIRDRLHFAASRDMAALGHSVLESYKQEHTCSL